VTSEEGFLRGVRVVDTVHGRVGAPKDIHLDGGRIASIVDASAADRPLYVVPGLIDAHVHLTFDASADPAGAYRSLDDEARVDVARRNAARAVLAGVTTVRDLGGPLAVVAEVAHAIARGAAPGPDVVFAGAAITRVGGHLGLLGGEVGGAAEARALVERQIAAGARAVKVVVSGGGLTPGTRPDRAELPAPVLDAAVEVARHHGVPVAAHCHATAAIRRAVEAGVSTIEHVSFVGPGGRVRFDPELARRMRDRGIAASPTVSGALRSATRYRVAGAHNPDEVDAIGRLEARPRISAELRAIGVTIVAGSDAGVTDTPHDSIHDDLAAYVDLGMSPADALRTATVDAADALGLVDRGVVAVGRRADLIVVDEDPLSDLAALRRPLAVIAAGALVSPKGGR
jgi:imidazolonepropionase-like amidohydrolase